MSSFTSFLERHLGSYYRTEIILGVVILILVIVLSLSYAMLQMSEPMSSEENVTEDWTPEDQRDALIELRVSAQNQGVPNLTSDEKLEIMNRGRISND